MALFSMRLAGQVPLLRFSSDRNGDWCYTSSNEVLRRCAANPKNAGVPSVKRLLLSKTPISFCT
jgi:hypothetical protein